MTNVADNSPDHSFFHRLRAGSKLAALFAFSILLFFINRPDMMAVVLVMTLVLYRAAGFSPIRAWQQIRPLWWMFAILFLFKLFAAQWQDGLVIVLRLADLLLFAGLVMLTTPVSRMMETLERGLRFLRPFGVHPAGLSLAFSLTLRFIPVLGQITREVRETQKARGLESNIIAALTPVIIRTVKLSEDIAAAIEARCYDDDR